MSSEKKSWTRSLVRRSKNTVLQAIWKAKSPFISGPNTYSALNSKSKEIRVLEVDAGGWDDILVCKLKHIRLDHLVPNYETISYCSGPPRRPFIIELDGKLVHVPKSSVAALRRMRLRNQPRRLWIDAICINQSSESEKNNQVAFMSTIYSTATRNLVYLGDSDAHLAERALASISALNDEMAAATYGYTAAHRVLRVGAGGEPAISTQDFSTDLDFAALEGLFSLPWFARLWVLQEASLAASSTCHWGALQFDLLNVARAAQWLMYKRTFLPDSFEQCKGFTCADIMCDYIDPITSLPSILGNLMIVARAFEKQEPRDNIYAIIGIVQRDGFATQGKSRNC